MLNKELIEKLLFALGEHLHHLGASPIELVVSGGAALNCMEFIVRTTKDIDCLAFLEKDAKGQIKLKQIEAFPEELMRAAEKVRTDFNLYPGWINFGPTQQVSTGLPMGIEDRLTLRDYGPKLRVYFINRFDQIHFKLYAAADQAGRHADDLLRLKPTGDELYQAATWCIGQDPSPGFKDLLVKILKRLGFDDIANRI